MHAALHNLLLNTDSYKASHWQQYRPGATAMFSYLESRGGLYNQVLFFGLQSILKEYLTQPITADMVHEAEIFFKAHGEPFNTMGWMHIVNYHGGYLPVKIRAVPEGMIIPTHQALMSIESTDAETFWVVSYIETLLLRVWYPMTVATISWHIKQMIFSFLEETSDRTAEHLPFALHDFGARGVSSTESAAIGGMAHLVNFQGTDTILGVIAAQHYYHAAMAGFSIPAAEHSTITSWGKDREIDAYRHMLHLFAKPGAVLAVVSDSYDIFAAIDAWGSVLRGEVENSGATLVIRPDSGQPAQIVLQALDKLSQSFGYTINSKGFKSIRHVRIIQGDGINYATIREILSLMRTHHYAADNVFFGMGGALLQRLDRDTQRFALKCSAIRTHAGWEDVYKEPVTDLRKTSRRGRLSLFQSDHTGEIQTKRLEDSPQPGWSDLFIDVWKEGELYKDWSFHEIRERSTYNSTLFTPT